jgi:hypothetical protein
MASFAGTLLPRYTAFPSLTLNSPLAYSSNPGPLPPCLASTPTEFRLGVGVEFVAMQRILHTSSSCTCTDSITIVLNVDGLFHNLDALFNLDDGLSHNLGCLFFSYECPIPIRVVPTPAILASMVKRLWQPHYTDPHILLESESYLHPEPPFLLEVLFGLLILLEYACHVTCA